MIFLKLYWREICIFIAVFFLGYAVSSAINKQRILILQNEFNTYKLVQAEAQAKQEKLTAEAISYYIDVKATTDEIYAKTINDLKSANNRLRNERASNKYLPPNSSGAAESNRICFRRAELESAIGQLDDGFSKIAGESDNCRVKLQNIKDWYKKLKN